MALPSTPSSQIQTSDCAHLTLVTYIRILKLHLPRVESVPHHVAGLPQTLLHFIFCNFMKMDFLSSIIGDKPPTVSLPMMAGFALGFYLQPLAHRSHGQGMQEKH